MTDRVVVHDCDESCHHGGPIYVRWPWEAEGSITEQWPPSPDREAMPPGIAVAMGATVKLLEPLDGNA